MATISLAGLVRLRQTAQRAFNGDWDWDAILNREIYPAINQIRRLVIQIVDNIQPVDITPATLAANANNYSPTGHATATYVRISASTTVSITGFLASDFAYPFWEKTYRNIGASQITLTNEDAASDAANRVSTQGGLSLVLLQNDVATLRYDFDSDRVVVV